MAPLCLRRCEQCEYESNTYADGQKFSPGGDPCIQCRCSVGAVSKSSDGFSHSTRSLTVYLSPSGGSGVLRAGRHNMSHTYLQPPGPPEGGVLPHLPQSVAKPLQQFDLRPQWFEKLLKSRVSPLQIASLNRRCTPTGRPSSPLVADPA